MSFLVALKNMDKETTVFIAAIQPIASRDSSELHIIVSEEEMVERL